MEANPLTKIKIHPKSIDIPAPKRNTEQAPVQPESRKKKEKGILGKMLLLIRSDVHKKISENGKIKMPESKESWEDWKDQL
jgi:hypothetical protein